MNEKPLKTASLTIAADPGLMPVVATMAEQMGRITGLDDRDALKFRLAAEEIYNYLCYQSKKKRHIRIDFRCYLYHLNMEMTFEFEDFPIDAFNLTSLTSLDSDGVPRETGLLIASRVVDHFDFYRRKQNICIVLTKEKSYPLIGEISLPEVPLLEDFAVREAETEEVKLFVHLVHKYHSRYFRPPEFQFPGKVADMTESGQQRCLIAVDKAENIGGGLVLRFTNDKIIDIAGPYSFGENDEQKIAKALLEEVIRMVAKTHYIGLNIFQPVITLPPEYFEVLGTLWIWESGREFKVYYRHLREDTGAPVWCHPLLKPFLEEQYQRHFLARQIKLVTESGESRSPASVLSTTMMHADRYAIIRPIWWGEDAVRNIENHVRVLAKEGYIGIFFEMDLGRPWHCRFTPALLDAGFKPCIVFPHAGTGDLVDFSYRAGDTAS